MAEGENSEIRSYVYQSYLAQYVDQLSKLQVELEFGFELML